MTQAKMETSKEDDDAETMEKGGGCLSFMVFRGGEMVHPPPSYMTQAIRNAMVVFSVFSREVRWTP